jgi:hypothetical protein
MEINDLRGFGFASGPETGPCVVFTPTCHLCIAFHELRALQLFFLFVLVEFT